MLENNTDRSYFMIGAMVIAGAVVAAAAFIFGGPVVEYLQGIIETLGDSAEIGAQITVPDTPTGE